MPKHILFLIAQLTVGGIETYILRVARAAHASGIKVSVWVVKQRTDRELQAMLEQVATVRFLAPSFLPVPLWVSAPSFPEDVDLVFTTGRTSLLFAASAAARARIPVRLVAGVFSQWEYSVDDGSQKHTLAAGLISQLGSSNMVFCTEGCRNDHAAALGPAYASALVSPLLVELPGARSTPARQLAAPLRIVSVGRLVPFKTSNQQMPTVLAELKARGIEATWTLYGTGEELSAIEAAIARAGVVDNVVLAGILPYSKLHDTIAASDVYIGGGTTIIEASAIGVPALVALDENPQATSPGFFADTTGDYTSDAAPDTELVPIVDLLEQLARMGPEDIAAVKARSRARAARYDVANAPAELETIARTAKAVLPTLPCAFQIRFAMGSFQDIFSFFIARLMSIMGRRPEAKRRR
jgi:glycosyltransferase involved in cell wall biosynthesis